MDVFTFSKVSCPLGLGLLGLPWCFGRHKEVEDYFYSCILYCNNP